MTLKEKIKLFLIFARYWCISQLGLAMSVHKLADDPRFHYYIQKLESVLMNYEPEERDHVKRVLQFRLLPISGQAELKELALYHAAEALVVIEKMYSGHLHPLTMQHLIHPLEISYYKDLVQRYCEMLDHPDTFLQKVPLPFFYQIAAERLRDIHVMDYTELEYPILEMPVLPIPFIQSRLAKVS
jgi:hypothetical protein